MGDILSDNPTQVNMTNFRKKLAVILFDSELNDDDLRNQPVKDDETDTDPEDCVIMDRPPKKLKKSNSSQNLSSCHNHWSLHHWSIQ